MTEVWQQWTVGLAGDPPFRDLEAQYEHRWRPQDTASRTLWSRRRKVIDAVITRIRQRGMTEEEAVEDLERWRGDNTLYKLHKRLTELASESSKKRRRLEKA